MDGRLHSDGPEPVVKPITGIGIGLVFVVLLAAVILEGGKPASFLNLPAALIVFGGTMCATMASSDTRRVLGAPRLALKAMKGAAFDARGAVAQMVGLAEKARREGLLALESELEHIDDQYARKGVQLVVDGADSDLVRGILQAENDGMMYRHTANSALFRTAGGFAPTLGILGTVMSLVHVLENLSSPSTLGHSIAGAFLATLYGVGSANLVLLPIANKLREMSTAELQHRDLVLEGILSIQAGDNPRLLAEKLETFVAPDARGTEVGSPKAESAPVEPEPEPVPEPA